MSDATESTVAETKIKIVTKQSNGVDEMLTPERRVLAEQYYTEKSVGPTAQERYDHFRNVPELARAIFYNVNYDRQTENDTSRLSLLEWTLFQWNGEI